MSFEGYYQILCKNGHQWVADCYAFDDEEPAICSECGEMEAWRNLVDVTNGSYDENHVRIDGYIDLETAFVRKCGMCGTVMERRYKIPEKGNNV